MYTWVPASINLSLSDPSVTSPGTEAGEAGVWGDWGWTSLEKLEVRVTHLTHVTKYYVTQITCHDITHPALSAVPSPRVTKAPSKFSATFCNPVSKVEVISLAALPSYKRNVLRICWKTSGISSSSPVSESCRAPSLASIPPGPPAPDPPCPPGGLLGSWLTQETRKWHRVVSWVTGGVATLTPITRQGSLSLGGANQEREEGIVKWCTISKSHDDWCVDRSVFCVWRLNGHNISHSCSCLVSADLTPDLTAWHSLSACIDLGWSSVECRLSRNDFLKPRDICWAFKCHDTSNQGNNATGFECSRFSIQ